MKFPEQHNEHHSPNVKFLWLATSVLILAAAFRLVALHDLPPGLAQDEVLNADIVSFIQHGKHSLFFREGYGHEPLYHYWSVPFRPLLGDNVLAVRLPAVFLGLLLIAWGMRWAQREFGTIVAVTMGLGLAISWWPIIFSRIGIRPILEPVLLVAMAHAWPRRPWLAGVFLGLSFYSYTAARVTILIPLIHILYLFVTQRYGWSMADNEQSRRHSRIGNLRFAVVVLLVAAVLYLPLGMTLRADPTLQQRVRQLEGPLVALQDGDIGPLLDTTVATLGVFSFMGDPRWTYTIPGRPLFDPLTAVLFYAGLLLALFRWRKPQYAFILIWLGAGLLPSALTPQAPSTVRLIGSMPVVYLLPGLAVARLWQMIRNWQIPATFKQRLVFCFGLLIAAVFAFNLVRTVRDGFYSWPAELETRFKYQTILLDIGRHWQEESSTSPVVATGFFESIAADSFRRNLGYDPGARWVQSGMDVAGAIVFPNDVETAGAGHVYVPEFAPLDNDLMAKVGISPDPLFRSEMKPSFAIYALPPIVDIPVITPTISFDDKIVLVGYEIEPLRAGSSLQLHTYWRVEASLPWDLAAFVHMLDAEARIVTQHDGLDVAPSTLLPGDFFVQRHVLPLPEPRSVEAYALQIGLYTRGNKVRLTHQGEPADIYVLANGWFLTENQ